jgi:hypothetical protein
VVERSKARVYGRSLAWIAGSNPAGVWMFVCCKCCVLSGRGLQIRNYHLHVIPNCPNIRSYMCNLNC